MKKILLVALLLPLLVFAQNDKTSLSTYGLNASMGIDSALAVERIEQEESDLSTPEIKIFLNVGERITITQLNKKMNLALIKSQYKQVLTKKHKSVTIKALVNSGNDLLIERTYKDDGGKIYKFLLLRVIKGKEYLIEGSETNEESLARKMMALAKTIK
ncbi:MAG: hypothetical protein IPN26_08960 [Bacteroidetes bacterium]|nr:hypothetical protein [Bacteroidota bacterium]